MAKKCKHEWKDTKDGYFYCVHCLTHARAHWLGGEIIRIEIFSPKRYEER